MKIKKCESADLGDEWLEKEVEFNYRISREGWMAW
jgi:hypothetical protein